MAKVSFANKNLLAFFPISGIMAKNVLKLKQDKGLI